MASTQRDKRAHGQPTPSCEHTNTRRPTQPTRWSGTCPDCSERVAYYQGRLCTDAEAELTAARQLVVSQHQIDREAQLRRALVDVVAAYDHPADGTAFGRMSAAIKYARELLGLASVPDA